MGLHIGEIDHPNRIAFRTNGIAYRKNRPSNRIAYRKNWIAYRTAGHPIELHIEKYDCRSENSGPSKRIAYRKIEIAYRENRPFDGVSFRNNRIA